MNRGNAGTTNIVLRAHVHGEREELRRRKSARR
jgi:hypothetical protein